MRPSDVVICPSGKRARLRKWWQNANRWDACYVDEPYYIGGVLLNPKDIHLVDDE